MRVTVQGVLDAVDEVASWLPTLKIVNADCAPHSWLVDPDTDTIYVHRHQPVSRWADALLDALDALCDHYCHTRPGQLLRLIPTQATGRDLAARTGTSF